MNNNSKSVRATLLVLAQQIKSLVSQKKVICATRSAQLKEIKTERKLALDAFVKGTITKKAINQTAITKNKKVKTEAKV